MVPQLDFMVKRVVATEVPSVELRVQEFELVFVLVLMKVQNMRLILM